MYLKMSEEQNALMELQEVNLLQFSSIGRGWESQFVAPTDSPLFVGNIDDAYIAPTAPPS